MNQPTEPHNNISVARQAHNTASDLDDPGRSAADRPVDVPSQLEAYVDELVAVCEQAEQHYFPAARASAPQLGRAVASDSTQPR